MNRMNRQDQILPLVAAQHVEQQGNLPPNNNMENLPQNAAGVGRTGPRKGFLWWGLIRKPSDFAELGYMALAPIGTLLSVLFALPTDNSKNSSNFQDALLLWCLALFFVVSGGFIFLFRSRRKHQRYHRLRASQDPPRALSYFCRHTFMELCMYWGAVALGQRMDYIYEYQRQDNYEATTWDFSLLYLQVFLATGILFRYYFQVQTISQDIADGIIPRIRDSLLVGAHLASLFLFLQGLATLTSLAWNKNPWSTPVYLLEAWAGVAIVARCVFRLPREEQAP